MSDTAQRSPEVAGGPSGGPAANGGWGSLRKAGLFLVRQREATVFVVVVLVVVLVVVVGGRRHTSVTLPAPSLVTPGVTQFVSLSSNFSAPASLMPAD